MVTLITTFNSTGGLLQVAIDDVETRDEWPNSSIKRYLGRKLTTLDFIPPLRFKSAV